MFHKLISVSAASPQVVRELAETSTKDLHVLAGFAQFLFKLWRTAQLGFLARRFCRGGWNSKGGKFRNFESVNWVSKVDTEGDLSFCSSPKLFRDRTPWYECRICIVSSALTYFLIVIIAQWDMMWSKWGEKFKGGNGFFVLAQKGSEGEKRWFAMGWDIFWGKFS